MHWFDLVILILLVLALIKGFMGGLVMQIASLAGIIIGAIFAGQLSVYIEPQLGKLIESNPHVVAPLSYTFSFLIIFISLIIVGRILHKFVKAIQLNLLNRIVGSVFCCAKWAFIFSLLINIIVQFDENKWIIKEDIRKESYVYPLVKDFAPEVIPYLRFDKK